MHAPAVFTFTAQSVRVVMIDDAPWFVATDVTVAIGIDRTQTRRLDDDENGVCSIHTPSGQQESRERTKASWHQSTK